LAWRAPGYARRQPGGGRQPQKSTALELYLADHIQTHSGGRACTVDDLVKIIAERPVLLALDGLDEVADLAERQRVAKEIVAATTRLTATAVDLVVLVSTRPGATAPPTGLPERFPTLRLDRLTPQLRLQYLDRWASQAGLSPSESGELRESFVEKQELPHVRELAANPMQLAILLHLVQRRGILPEQRTQLYSDYVKVFFDREARKEPVVRQHRLLFEGVHAFLAWHLQSEAERGHTSGQLALDDLRELLEDFLRDHGQRGDRVVQMFNAMTSRVICLVQRHTGFFEFEVQPLREYFAAKHLHDEVPLRSERSAGDRAAKDDRLVELLKRPYWSNELFRVTVRCAK
jgi:hypothetical protein